MGTGRRMVVDNDVFHCVVMGRRTMAVQVKAYPEPDGTTHADVKEPEAQLPAFHDANVSIYAVPLFPCDVPWRDCIPPPLRSHPPIRSRTHGTGHDTDESSEPHAKRQCVREQDLRFVRHHSHTPLGWLYSPRNMNKQARVRREIESRGTCLQWVTPVQKCWSWATLHQWPLRLYV